MSDKVKQLFDSLRNVGQAVLDRLSQIGPEFGAELKRVGAHGANELASANHSGNAWVPYGVGQYTPEIEQNSSQEMEHEMERNR